MSVIDIAVTSMVAAMGGLIFDYDVEISGGVTSMDPLTMFTSSLYLAALLSLIVGLTVTRNSLRSSAQKVIVLATEVKSLKEDKECLRINLTRAEEEVNAFFEQNKILDKENERLTRHIEKSHPRSAEKHNGSNTYAKVDSSAKVSVMEQLLLESLVTTLVGNDKVATTAHAFLEANSGVEACQKLLKMWNSLRPSAQKVLALAAEVKYLKEDKERLRINLIRAEDEVNAFFEQNKILDKENETRHKEKSHPRSTEKYNGSSTSAKVDSSAKVLVMEQLLLESLVATLVGNDKVATTAHAFLEANSGEEACQKLLKMWNSLRPSAQKTLALAAEVKSLQEDKERLRINITRAEEEVNALFEQNKLLDKENERLTRHKEKSHLKFAKKHNSRSTSAKVDSSAMVSVKERLLLESLVTTLLGNDKVATIAHAFLEANSRVEACQKLLKMSKSLRPSPQKILALAAEVKSLLKDKDRLGINLTRAEEEVNVFFEQNKILDKENVRLTRHKRKIPSEIC